MTNKRILDIDGIPTEVLESGGQGDPIFIFHGNSSAADSFRRLMDGALGQRHRIVAVSFPGHGGSAQASEPEAMYSIQMLGRFASQVVRAHGAARYWLVGQSMGGHALMESIDRFPGAQGLLLISSPPVSLATLGEAFRPDPSAGCLFKGELTEDEIALLVRCFGEKLPGPDQALLAHNIKRTDPEFRPFLGMSLARGDMLDERALLDDAPFPVAILGGTDDRFLNADYYASLPAHKLWKNQAILFEDSGHMLHLEQPERFEAVLSEYVGAAEAL